MTQTYDPQHMYTVSSLFQTFLRIKYSNTCLVCLDLNNINKFFLLYHSVHMIKKQQIILFNNSLKNHPAQLALNVVQS